MTKVLVERIPRQRPYKRVYPTGRSAWIARYFDIEGKPRYAKPAWNGGKGSFKLRREAQQAIDEALSELYEVRTEPQHWSPR
jgi:hypothetical protein